MTWDRELVHSTIHIPSCDTLYRHYFKWKLSVDISSLSVRVSVYLDHSAKRPHVQFSNGRKWQATLVRWNNHPVYQNTQCRRLIIDTHPLVWWFNSNIQLLGHSEPLQSTLLPSIKANTPFLFVSMSSNLRLSFFRHSCKIFAAFHFLTAVLLWMHCFLGASLCR